MGDDRIYSVETSDIWRGRRHRSLNLKPYLNIYKNGSQTIHFHKNINNDSVKKLKDKCLTSCLTSWDTWTHFSSKWFIGNFVFDIIQLVWVTFLIEWCKVFRLFPSMISLWKIRGIGIGYCIEYWRNISRIGQARNPGKITVLLVTSRLELYPRI